MKVLIFTGVIVLFVGIVVWKVMRASKSESGCSCDTECVSDCDCQERKP
jgi:hypothetical protein